MRVLILGAVLATSIAQSVSDCATMLCPSGTMCVTPQCVTTPCPSTSCVPTSLCPVCPQGQSCRLIDGNYVCREPVSCCLTMPSCPSGSIISDCTDQEVLSGVCTQHSMCCQTIKCRPDTTCGTIDCCTTGQDMTVTEKVNHCRCLSESATCAAVDCSTSVDCGGVSICDTNPCDRSSVCVPSTIAPYSGFQCQADPCATGPCPANHFCEVKNGQATCTDLTNTPCCEAFPVCDSYEQTSTTPCSVGEANCRRHHMCCSEVYCRGSPPAAATSCAHGPCGSNEWCVDEPKNCVRSPCPQYRCDPMPEACCAAAAVCPAGAASSSTPCSVSEGSSCTRAHICCHEVFCRSGVPQPPINNHMDPCVSRPCSGSSYCNVIPNGYECTPNIVQCQNAVCTEMALQCPTGYSSVQSCAASVGLCIRVERKECCQDQICMRDVIYSTTPPSSDDVDDWVWAVVGASAAIAIALAIVLVWWCCRSSKDEPGKSESDIQERIPTPIKVQPTKVVQYPFPEEMPAHPIPQDWKHSTSSDEKQLV